MKNKSAMLGILLFGVSPTVFGSEKCAKVKVEPGEACKDLIVHFDLSRCKEKDSDVLAETIQCKEHRARAKLTTESARYEVNLEQPSSAWGTKNWTIVGEVKEKTIHTVASNEQRHSESRSPASVSHPEPTRPVVAAPHAEPAQSHEPIPAKETTTPPTESQRSPASVSQPPPTHTTEAERAPSSIIQPKPTQLVSGFLDGQFMGASRGDLSKGFVLNDGAVYIFKETPELQAKLDLPFRMFTVGGPNFEFAIIRAQAYVSYNFFDAVRVKIGQWDTSFGLESNDTVDIPFTRQGSVYNFTDPFVHMGMMLSHDFSPETVVNVYITNPNDRGVLTGQNLQFGAQFIKTGNFRYSLGGLANKDTTLTGFNYYLDATLGITVGALAWDAEVSLNKSLSMNTAAPAYLLQGIYTISEKVALGVRGEYVNQLAKADSKSLQLSSLPTLDRQILVFFGPQYSLTPELKLKADLYTQVDYATAASSGESVYGFNAGMVYKF